MYKNLFIIFLLGCIALGVDTGNIGILDLSQYGSPALSFLWQSIPADVYRLAWHPIREGRIAYLRGPPPLRNDLPLRKVRLS